MNPIRVFIGFDNVEAVAYNVFAHSILRRATQPISITPVALRHLRDLLTRPRDPKQSNDFSFSRWLVPFLCGYEGWAIFADCDMLCREDIAQLWALRDPNYAVQVVKHNHRPRESVKYLGQPQTAYDKKNWSSVMLMNTAKCGALTPHYVNSASGLDLHQFAWLSSDDLIGGLPKEWNHLVDYDKPNPDAKIVHFTLGGPYFFEHAMCEFAAEWAREFRAASYCKQIVDEPEA